MKTHCNLYIFRFSFLCYFEKLHDHTTLYQVMTQFSLYVIKRDIRNTFLMKVVDLNFLLY
jgi:hypothetical protein